MFLTSFFISRYAFIISFSLLYLYLKETVEEFRKLFVENEVLKDSVTGLQQQYRSIAESNEVSRYLV